MQKQPASDSEPGQVLLELRDVVKGYPGVVAVDDVSVAFRTGEIVGLVGKNGAGKSTIIKMLAGVVHPDRGSILLDGEEFTLATPHDATLRGMMFVHQELAVVPDLSVAENVFLGLGFPRRAGALVDFDALRSRAAAVLGQLADHIDPSAPIGWLPVADQRVCMIARALAASARVIVLDEPTASLTATEVDQLMAVLRRLRDRGLAIIYVSHRLDEIFALTDRTVVMRDGKVVADAPTETFDNQSLIEQITGDAAASTALERRQLRGVGGTPDTEVTLAVEALQVPGRLADVSFDVHRGEILGIAGLVGAGRTELVRAIFGAETGSSGRVAVHGQDTAIRNPSDALKAGIVLFPEDRRHQGLVLDFSVRHNLTLGMLRRERFHRLLPFPSARRERTTALGLVDALSIKTPSDGVPAKWLSGGNQQKVVIGRWLKSPSDIFMFDEPTHGIDVGSKEEIYQLIEGLAIAGRSIIFISSEFSELVGVCNRILVIREGALVGELAGEEITERAILEMCYGRSVA